MMHLGAIPKQKQQRQINNGDQGLGFGSNLDEDILNLTPIGLNSPKRRLLWSPETPDGRSRKYSIGETASPNLKKRISGVIAINGRYAIPSLDNGIELTAVGIESLSLDKHENIQTTQGMEDIVQKPTKLKRKSPTLKVKTSARRGRGRGKKSHVRPRDPKQMLISDMVKDIEVNEGVNDCEIIEH